MTADLEQTIAHLTRAVDDLSAEVVRQGKDLDRVQRQVRLLMERAAEAEADGSAVFGDDRPPHY